MTNVLHAAAAKAAGATFAGFTNGDIAFDTSLIATLNEIGRRVKLGRLSKRVLVIGRRLNLYRPEKGAKQIAQLFWNDAPPPSIYEALRAMGNGPNATSMSPIAEDYFFFTPGTFDWRALPNYIIGRVGWDSFVTQWAIDSGVVRTTFDRLAAKHAQNANTTEPPNLGCYRCLGVNPCRAHDRTGREQCGLEHRETRQGRPPKIRLSPWTLFL